MTRALSHHTNCEETSSFSSSRSVTVGKGNALSQSHWHRMLGKYKLFQSFPQTFCMVFTVAKISKFEYKPGVQFQELSLKIFCFLFYDCLK